MPQIRNLEAQKQALADIESLLKEISVINDFLIEQGKYKLGTYTISFSVKNPKEEEPLNRFDENQSEEFMSEQDVSPEDKPVQKIKKAKRGSKYVKHEAPFLCDNNAIIRTYVLHSKQEKANKILELSSEFNIFLDDNDMNILNMFKEEL